MSKKEKINTELEKSKVLELCLDEIEKKFGKGSIMKLGDAKHIVVEVVPTGIPTLDLATGVGGFPRGRIIEIFGPESSGKTTVALHTIAEAQKQGGAAAFIDAEHAIDPSYAKKLGVNLEELLVSQPDYGEQALEICEYLVKSGAIDVVVVDSVAALVPHDEIKGEMGAINVGLQARLMSQAMRKLTAIVAKSRAIVIFINQLREKIGNNGYGSPEVTTGGRALKFYSSMRLDVRKKEDIKQGEQRIGYRSKIKVVKNKVAPPFKEADCECYYNEGFSREAALLDLAEAHKIITKSGSWYSYGEERLGQGRENVRIYLKDNKKLALDIEDKIKVISNNVNITAEKKVVDE
ncbi:RecA protein [Desulforamulus putei DSM 12395]|uniref:Protein RecA n=1 Tax=Desulforamulus putei DSM 12395 TaxID=1121429 RepID=A0A1M5BXI3_9FIRM|nr:recombinase RecA [Desulforamulus putei]SHF47037.1 RecA protein [Desulforamulus putei DSM 12395]